MNEFWQKFVVSNGKALVVNDPDMMPVVEDRDSPGGRVPTDTEYVTASPLGSTASSCDTLRLAALPLADSDPRKPGAVCHTGALPCTSHHEQMIMPEPPAPPWPWKLPENPPPPPPVPVLGRPLVAVATPIDPAPPSALANPPAPGVPEVLAPPPPPAAKSWP